MINISKYEYDIALTMALNGADVTDVPENYIRPTHILGKDVVKDLGELPLKKITEIKDILQTRGGDTIADICKPLLSIIFETTQEKVGKMKYCVVVDLTEYYLKDLERLSAIENQIADDFKRSMSTEERIAQHVITENYGYYTIVDQLAKGDITKYQQIWDTDFNTILLKQKKDIQDRKYQKKYYELINKQK